MTISLSLYAHSKVAHNAALCTAIPCSGGYLAKVQQRKSAVDIGAVRGILSLRGRAFAPLIVACLVLGLSTFISNPANGTPNLPRTDIHCMAEAVYHEARGESVTGMVAVAAVVLNRVSATGKGICDVIYERSQREKGVLCQFSFTCVPAPQRRVREMVAWERSLAVAKRFVPLAGKHPDPTNGAMYFNTCSGTRTPPKGITRIGQHCFRRGAGFAPFKSPGYSGQWTFLHDGELLWSERLVAMSHVQSFEQLAQASGVTK